MAFKVVHENHLPIQCPQCGYNLLIEETKFQTPEPITAICQKCSAAIQLSPEVKQKLQATLNAYISKKG